MARKIIPPLDLMFYLTESAQSPKHVGAVQVFQLPKDAPDNYLRDLVAAFKKAPVVEPFKLPRAPFGPAATRQPRATDGSDSTPACRPA